MVNAWIDDVAEENVDAQIAADKKAAKKLKMDAAKLGCPFVLQVADKTTVGANSNALGGSQAIKTGVAYKY